MNAPAPTELLKLADRIAGHLGPFNFVTKDERDVVVAALRQAASVGAEVAGEAVLTFGALVENIAASDRNPIKHGIFIRKTSAKMAEYATKEGCHSTPLDNLRALASPPPSKGVRASEVQTGDVDLAHPERLQALSDAADYVEKIGARYHSGWDIANGIRCLGPRSSTVAQAEQVWPKEIRSLVNEIAGVWDAFEIGLRQEISNTNYAVVREKLSAVENLMAPPVPSAERGTDPHKSWAQEVRDAYANGFADGKLAHLSPPAISSTHHEDPNARD